MTSFVQVNFFHFEGAVVNGPKVDCPPIVLIRSRTLYRLSQGLHSDWWKSWTPVKSKACDFVLCSGSVCKMFDPCTSYLIYSAGVDSPLMTTWYITKYAATICCYKIMHMLNSNMHHIVSCLSSNFHHLPAFPLSLWLLQQYCLPKERVQRYLIMGQR